MPRVSGLAVALARPLAATTALATADGADAPRRAEARRVSLLPSQPLALALRRAQLLAQQARAVPRSLRRALRPRRAHVGGGGLVQCQGERLRQLVLDARQLLDEHRLCSG